MDGDVQQQEAKMRSTFYCAVAAAVLAAAGPVSAQTTIIERDGPAVIERDAPVVVTRERVVLTPAQRTTIYRTVTRERVTVPPETVDVRVGARLPRTVELGEIPASVIEEVPAVRRYRYMVVNNEVLLVDPATSEVIEVIRQ